MKRYVLVNALTYARTPLSLYLLHLIRRPRLAIATSATRAIASDMDYYYTFWGLWYVKAYEMTLTV